MNLQTNEAIDYVTDEDNGEQDFLAFADLELTDEQLSEVKGGPGWCSACGIIFSNHNETTAEDDAEDEAELEDLFVSEEQDDAVRGGAVWIERLILNGSGVSPTRSTANHNETTAEDTEDEAELEDLFVSEEQDDAVKGGCAFCGGIKLNHNETTAEDDAEDEAESLDDLPITTEQEMQVVAGTHDGRKYKMLAAPVHIA